MRVVFVAPRAPYSEDMRSSSIDLCISDLIKFSRYRATTTVIGDHPVSAFADISFQKRPIGFSDTFLVRRSKLLRSIRDLNPDVVCVEEHLRTAAYLTKKLPEPVLFHVHNPVKAPKNAFHQFIKNRKYNNVRDIIFVSDNSRRSFETHWPAVRADKHVVSNGLDISQWTPAASRKKTVLVVGRAIQEKGIWEAARALARTLPHHPDWNTVFILSEVQGEPDYFRSVQAELGFLGRQVTLLVQQSPAVVKQWMENAAIAITPSICNESFGRVALEAHAGGAALISSGTGGLSEVSGPDALYLPAVSPEEISKAVTSLITDDAKRENLGTRGQQRAQMFDIHKIASSLDDIFDRKTNPK